MLHGEICNRAWGWLGRLYPECQLYLLDAERDELMGVGNTVPVAWDGTAAGLPGGIDDVLTRTILQPASQTPTALCALQAAVLPGHQGRGLSAVIIGGMREVAGRLNVPDLIAPVRPNMKSRYPLTPIEQYVEWCSDDGLPLDPWLRVHARLGAAIVRIAERSMTIRGAVAEWEAWTGLAFPASGEYVVPVALTPITIDRERDVGLYVEPNVWMRRRLSPA
jgi:hypothetical protein